MTKVIYCIWCYDKNFDEAKVCIERVQPGVDAVCVVGNSLKDEQVKWLKDRKCVIKLQPFRDNFIEQRNTYLDMARELDAEAWILVSDPDELFNEELVRDLKKLIPALEEKGYTAAGINCLEKFKEEDLTDESDLQSYHQIFGEGRESNYFKLLLFKVYPDTTYVGAGEMKVLHETWGSISHPARAIYLDKKYKYEHKKSAFRMWENSSRNVFMAGGGNSVGSVNPAWVELRAMCREELGIASWEQFRDYMKKGNICKSILDWLLNNMLNTGLDYISETTQISKWYFSMHPDEWNALGKPKVKFKPSPRATAEYAVARAFLDTLGRHPDPGAKKFYSNQILAGKVKPSQLPDILKHSQEYKDKFGLLEKTNESKPPPETKPVELPSELVTMSIPIKVDVRVSKDTFERAVMKSELFWKEIKPKLDLGEFIENSIADKEDFYTWFYKSKTEGDLTLEQLIERFKAYEKSEKQESKKLPAEVPF